MGVMWMTNRFEIEICGWRISWKYLNDLLFFICKVSKTSSSIRVTPSTRNSTTNSISVQPTSETQMLRLLNSAAQKREVKATQNLSIIVAFFMICWIPLYTINCINAFCKQCFINESVIYFGIILSHLNSAINPLLYAAHLKVSF
jgi:adenosine receptor A2a